MMKINTYLRKSLSGTVFFIIFIQRFYSKIMPKNIVFPYVTFNKFFEEPLIKKLSLFYDNIYIGEGRFSIVSDLSRVEMNDENQSLFYEKAVWDFLRDNDVVRTYPYFNEKFEGEEQEVSKLKAQLNDLFLQAGNERNFPKNPTQDQLAEMKKEYFNHFFLTHDLSNRLDALHLRKRDESAEYYPLLRTYDTLNSKEKKSEVIQFILNDIPEPAFDTHWDHIIEFRTDADIKNKYLALTSWINKVSTSTQKLSEIRDEYDYLYSDYLKQFKLHKMKYNNSVLEVIVNSTVNFIANIASGNYVSSVKDLFQFNIKNANLLQEEAKLPGKEVAYIFHVKEKLIR
ncbi:hypothetical protein G7074_25840 [Pedobacter sp. HDW13]|uniref:hypothetical protein n=1 Tax=Pedobacter sp. HDW13 TaxID=2714940 RepID=UPI001408610E|nr:hypothetical protein [Pedobacter sp. HDW13]QIL42381.1 hypothetical protein G7074_25840 [Pedobacter sp. HDW13]